MRKMILVLSTLLLLVTVNAHALELADISLKNDGFTGKFEYYVDLYLVSTGDTDFEVGGADLTFTYNTDVLSNPVLSHENPDFHDNGLYDPMALDNSEAGETKLQVNALGTTGTILPSSEIRLGRITFTVDNAFYATETAGIAWVDGSTFTFVEDINGVSIFLSKAVSLDGNTSLVCFPDISGAPDNTAEVGRVYSFVPTISDGCGTGSLDITITSKPGWADFDTSTGELSGIPDFADVNTYSGIVITVEDSYGDATSLSTFDLDVVCPPGPTLSGAPVTSISAGNSYNFTPMVSDGCGTLTYDIANKPSWASFNTDTGALAGTPALADVGRTDGVVISVIDENGLSGDLASFNIEVTAGCAAPVISGTPATSVARGSAYSFIPTVSNGCGTLAFDIVNQPSWASFDTATGALTGTPEADDVEAYSNIEITVTDELNTSDTLAVFNIDVTNTGSSSGSSSGGDSSGVDDGSSSSGGGGGGGGCFITTVR